MKNMVVALVMGLSCSQSLRAEGSTLVSPIEVTVNVAGLSTPVLVISGTQANVVESSPSVQRDARAIYVVRAEDGAMVWSAGHADAGVDTVLPEMCDPVIAAPAVVDLDSDGLADRIYIVDVTGHLMRFDINAEATGGFDFARGGLIAELDAENAESGRQFLSAPDISMSLASVRHAAPVLTIALGSSSETEPMRGSEQNRFFVIVDPDVRPETRQMFVDGPVRDLYLDLYDATDGLLDSEDTEVQLSAQQVLNERRGAFIELAPGESVQGRSMTLNNTVLFSTLPSCSLDLQPECQPESGRLYAVTIWGLRPTGDRNQSGGTVTNSDRYIGLREGSVSQSPSIRMVSVDGAWPSPQVFVGDERVVVDMGPSLQKTSWVDIDEPGTAVEDWP